MKNIIFLILAIAFVSACQNEQAPSKETKAAPADHQELIDPDTTDDVPADRYTATTADMAIAEKIRGFLVNDLLKEDLPVLLDNQRSFIYQSHDLNDDGQEEYLVGFENSYFCGSGGCTYFLLNNGGSLINRFSVSRSPFIVMEERSNGWRNLVVYSNRQLRKLVFDGSAYPANPSVEAEYPMTPGEELPRLLWDEFPIPRFAF